MPGPVGGVDYPRTWAEFTSWFGDEAACVAYLERLRWADGFVCEAFLTSRDKLGLESDRMAGSLAVG